MDFEYDDDVEQSDIEQFADVLKAHPFSDDDVKSVFKLLITGEEPVVLHDMFAFEYRPNDISDARITRVCKSLSTQIFRIQFLNGTAFILRFSNEHSFEGEIAIINAVAGVEVEVPRSYFSHPEGLKVGNQKYFVVLEEYVPGKNFEYAVKHELINFSDKEIILEEMGKRLKRIHSVVSINGKMQDNEQVNFLDEALALLDHERASMLDQGICRAEEFEDIFSKLDSLRDVAGIFGSENFGLAHMEYRPKNVILNLETARPTIRAIVEWSDAQFTNTFFDFALWDYWCGEDFLVDSLMDSYGREAFSGSAAKLNIELTTICALILEVCNYATMPDFRATSLGLWQRLRHEVVALTY